MKLISWVDDGSAPWLFLEDAGDEPFSGDDPAHRQAAVRWLAEMHTGAANLEALNTLPLRGASFYRDYLASASRLTLQARSDIPGNALIETTLDNVDTIIDTLQKAWPALDDVCALMPATLAHGDFAKNIRVTRHVNGTTSVGVFDWEMAGVGPPAADLARVYGSENTGDLASYTDIARRRWSGIGKREVTRMAHAGLIFRNVAALHWSCETLRPDKLDRPLRNMTTYANHLSDLVTTL